MPRSAIQLIRALILTFDPATGIPTNTVRRQGSGDLGRASRSRHPYVYAYSLEGQYSLPGQLTWASVGYQGSASRKLMRIVNERFEFPNTTTSLKNVFFPTPDTTASYNALLRFAWPPVCSRLSV